MKKLIVAFLVMAFANVAMANDENDEICWIDEEMILEKIDKCEKINKEIEKDWLIFLKYAGRYHIVKDKPYPNDYREDFIPEHFAFLKKHFTPIWYEITTNDKGQKVAKETCFNSTGAKICKYRLNAPFKIKGKVNIRAGSPIGEGCGDVAFDAEIEYEDYSFWIYMPYLHLQIKPNEHNQKVVRENIPKWMLDGFGGEVSYEVEFEVANMSGYIGDFSSSVKDIALTLDKSACGYPSYIVADNIKFIKKLSEKKYKTVEQYFRDIEYYGMSVRDSSLKLRTKDSFVNLRNSPNGEVLRKIYKKDFGDILVIEIPQTRLLGFNQNINKKWVKVLYFPPHTHKVKDATLGYIHKSQISKFDYYID